MHYKITSSTNNMLPQLLPFSRIQGFLVLGYVISTAEIKIGVGRAARIPEE